MSEIQKNALTRIGEIAREMRRGYRLTLSGVDATLNLPSGTAASVEDGRVVCSQTVGAVVGHYHPRGERLSQLRQYFLEAFPKSDHPVFRAS